MNDRFFINIFLVLFSFVLSLTGVLFLLRKLLVKKGLYIFNYHSFNTLENDYWTFGNLFTSNYRRNFEKQIRLIDKLLKPIDTLHLDDLSLDEPKYLITFDDGYKDNHDIAFPVLKKHNIPSIFFIATGPIGTNDLLWYDEVRYHFEKKDRKKGFFSIRAKKELKRGLSDIKEKGFLSYKDYIGDDQHPTQIHDPLMMDWNEVREAHRHGIQIGCHTHTHPILTQLDRDGQHKEIKISLEKLDNEIGTRSISFAYPQGDATSVNSDTVQLLKDEGIRYAFTTIPGANFDTHSPYHLKRIGIKASDPLPVVKIKIIIASVLEMLKQKRFKKFQDPILQYGFLNSFRRAWKKILRFFGVYYESYYVLHRFLDEEIKTFDFPGDVEVKKVDYQDYKKSKFYSIFSQAKRDLYEKRFSNDKYEAFGVILGGTLVYLTWIATDSLEFEYFDYEIKLRNNEGVLVDSFAMPEARRLGIHKYMNGFRLQRLKEKGVHKVYAAVITENVPAIKTQLKHGFNQGEKITGLRLGKTIKIFKNDINWKKIKK